MGFYECSRVGYRNNTPGESNAARASAASNAVRPALTTGWYVASAPGRLRHFNGARCGSDVARCLLQSREPAQAPACAVVAEAQIRRMDHVGQSRQSGRMV